MLEKFQIKYGWKEFEIRNDFSYRNFSRFETEFELKFSEIPVSWVFKEIHWKFLLLWYWVKFGKQAPGYTLLQEKINFPQKRIRDLNLL
jgi:hypothetical protein